MCNWSNNGNNKEQHKQYGVFYKSCSSCLKELEMATIVLTLVIVGLAVLLLGVKVFFVKGGRFPNTHIDDNPEMRKRGITCAKDKDF